MPRDIRGLSERCYVSPSLLSLYLCVYLFYRQWCFSVVSSCADEEGPESGEEAKEARGGRMQHREEGGEGGEEGGGGG